MWRGFRPKPVRVRRRALVNLGVGGIFNGIFEMLKSAQNEEKFAKMRLRETGGAGVYLAGIKYNAQPSEIRHLLSFVRSAHLAAITFARAGAKLATADAATEGARLSTAGIRPKISAGVVKAFRAGRFLRPRSGVVPQSPIRVQPRTA